MSPFSMALSLSIEYTGGVFHHRITVSGGAFELTLMKMTIYYFEAGGFFEFSTFDLFY
jgi:hypothetical protein